MLAWESRLAAAGDGVVPPRVSPYTCGLMADGLRATEGDALVVVDVQVDFLSGGRLSVPGGDAVVPVLNAYLALWRARGLPVIATRDWHPPDHASFRAQGGPWPSHCVAGTPGAAFAPGLALPPDAVVVSKGTRRTLEGYSAFEETDLDDRLRALAVRRLFVGGLATEYCVRHTVDAALARGWWTALLVDAIRAVDVAPGDGARACAALRAHGAVVVDRATLA